MADQESKETDPPRGNEWEVVTLTASAYAAAPGPERPHLPEEDNLDAKHESETSSPMFMSKHFVFPPSQHENLPLEPEFNKEIHIEEKETDDVVSRLVKSDDEFQGLILDEYPISGGKGKSLSNVDIGNAQSIYDSAEFSSFRETTIGMPANAVVGEEIDDSVKPIDNSALQEPQKSFEGEHSLPCEAWWKRQAFSIYAHAKEANTFWSIFITATVMGLVIIGHQWKILHLRHDERMSRMVGPISRFKDLIVGGHRPGSLVRGGTAEL